jgi:peroxiredoxin Q/BCP
MSKLKEGDKAPVFSGLDQNGKPISLGDFKGKRLILYFYPKDNTPGCTAEACNLNDKYAMLIEKGFELIGVSADTPAKHLNFIAKYNLAFNLIADTEHKIIEDYGLWAEKKMFGKTYMGIVRTTFIISTEGIIEKVFSKVKTKEHAEQILKELEIK